MMMQQIPWLGWKHEYHRSGQPPANLKRDNEDFIKMWDPFYRQLQPGEAWDSGTGAAPALTDLLASGRCEVAGKRVLIPGCGRGYDVAAFAQHKAQAVGLEVAPAAVDAAQKYLKDTLTPEEAARTAIELGDFLRWSPEAPFDIGYDYTFFCALPPALRKDVAHSWARVIKEGGLLVTLIFPVNGKDADTGPPFPVSPEVYKQHFTAAGFCLRSLEQVPPERSHPGRGGMEFMATWERMSAQNIPS